MTSSSDYQPREPISVESDGTLFDVIVSQDESILATVNDTHAILIYQNENMLTATFDYVETTSRTVALAPKGLNLAVVGNGGTADVFGQCD